MHPKKKIVLITGYPFNKRDNDRFGIDILRKNGFLAEIWDVSFLIYSDEKEHLAKEERRAFEGLRIFREKKEIVDAIFSLDEYCLINYMMEYSSRTYFMLRAISKKRIDYCVWGFVTLPHPTPVQQTGFAQKIVSTIQKLSILKFRGIILHMINKALLRYHYLFGIAPASIILLGGEKTAECLSYPIDDRTVLLWAHYFDYDIYLQQKAKEEKDMQEYEGVFLDQYLPFHPDYIHMGVDFPMDPEIYYRNLCRFFSTLEASMDSRIVIAAHPRSDYKNLPEYFCGRSVIEGQTAGLVEHASFVITHTSTSIHYAILYHKPIVLITNDRLEKMISGKNILGLYNQVIAEELKKTPINIDHEYHFDWEKEMTIDEEAYRRYKNLYIKKEGTPEKPVWEIFSSYLMQEAQPAEQVKGS